MIAWISEGRPRSMQEESGWAGIMSLPRVLSLGDDGNLRIEPLPELQSLRRNHRRLENIHTAALNDTLTRPEELRPLEGVSGNCMEIHAVIDFNKTTDVGLIVCRSDSGQQTLVHYSPTRGHLALEVTRAHGQEMNRHAEIGPLELPAGELLDLRIFLDRSVIEVFANGRQCLTKRIYPDPESVGTAFYCWGGKATLRSLDAWDMEAI